VQLVVLAGEKIGQTFPVHRDTILGRSEESGVQIDDPEISRRHAILHCRGAEIYELEDLGSRNGTLLNGLRIERSDLQFGDRIQLGSRVVLQFVRHERVEDVLRHQQRLEMLGRLCAGVAHDLNNMLAVIVTNLECLEMALGEQGKPTDGISECVEDLKTATAHAAKLTPRLLSFGRADERQMGRIDLSLVCSELVPILRRTLPRSIAVEADIAPNLELLGIGADIQQVLMNLCINARDAMPGGGALRIVARVEPSASPQKQTIVRVSDTGEGMQMPVRERIFEPFFTTKKRGAGSGLGLSTVNDIVTAHGGRIEVDSAPGEGSTFTIVFPAPQPSRRPTAGNMQAVETLQTLRDRMLMIVGDEAILRRGLKRLLSRHDHRITEAPDSGVALERYRELCPDLVLLDLDSLHAESLLAQLREIDPAARVLLHTADAQRATADTARKLGASACVRRPLSPGELLDEVNRILSGA
jgi:signal transduction histidine kinase